MPIRWLVFFASLLGLDIVTKTLAIQHIPPMNGYYSEYPFGGIGIFSAGVTFSLNYVVNTGAAWGIFAGHSSLLFVLRSAIILGLILFLWKDKESVSKIPILFVLTGAIGNAIDYCLYGHVIDFLHFTFWGYSFPIFNLADSCITMGVLSMFLFPRKTKTAV
jgi:signal peptidase II